MEVIYKTCPMCRKDYSMKVDEHGMFEYEYLGKMIQEAFPKLNPMEREFIKTGYCPNCQSMLFGTDYKSKLIKEEK